MLSFNDTFQVRMLGNGRPFILELVNARILLANGEIQKLEKSINDSKEGWVSNATNLIWFGLAVIKFKELFAPCLDCIVESE
jgi:tRNA U54 and U55 pseudouridine synthase Pus10